MLPSLQRVKKPEVALPVMSETWKRQRWLEGGGEGEVGRREDVGGGGERRERSQRGAKRAASAEVRFGRRRRLAVFGESALYAGLIAGRDDCDLACFWQQTTEQETERGSSPPRLYWKRA